MTWTVLLGLTGCDIGDTTQWVVSKTVGTTVEVGKGVVEGTRAGIAEGRSGLDIDGVRVLIDASEIAEVLAFEVVAVGPAPGQVTVGIQNRSERPVRIGKLVGPGETLAIDAGGFARPLLAAPAGHLLGAAVDVPANAKIETVLQFEDSGRPITAVRIAGVEVAAE